MRGGGCCKVFVHIQIKGYVVTAYQNLIDSLLSECGREEAEWGWS